MADKKISQLTPSALPLAGTEVLPIVQSGATVKVASNDLTVKNIRSNATTGLLQVSGPAVGSTRVMTTPDANFTVARTDASQTFTGDQTISDGLLTVTKSGVPQISLVNTSGTTKNTQLLYSDNAGIKWRLGMDVATNNNTNNFQLFSGTASASYMTMSSAGNLSVDVGNLVVGTAGKGIDFSANSHAAGMTSELLTWYEEGAFTPTMTATTPGDLAVTYADQYGKYTRIGRQVTVNIFINASVFTHTTASGNFRIAGLPFTSANITQNLGIGSMIFNGITKAGYTNFVCGVGPNTAYIQMTAGASGTAASAVAIGDVPSGGTPYFYLTVSYMA